MTGRPRVVAAVVLLVAAANVARAARPVVNVIGAGRCPSAEDVTARLADYLPAEASSGDAAHVASLLPEGHRIRLELRDENGNLLADRQLSGTASCAALAENAAVVLAAWEARLRPGLITLPSLTRAAPPAVVPAEVAPPESAPILQSVAVVESPPLAVEAGAVALAAVAAGGTIADAGLEVTLGRRGGVLAVRLAGLASSAHTSYLGPGQVSWSRQRGSVGLRARTGRGRWFGDVTGDGVLARLVLSGDKYDVNRRDTDLDPGLAAGARVGLRVWRVAPWIGVGVLGWLRPQIVEVTPLPDRRRLPRLELTAGMGVNVAIGPAGASDR